MLTLTTEEEYKMYEPKADSILGDREEWVAAFPEAWAESAGLGLANQQPPVVITLKPSASPIRVRQY